MMACRAVPTVRALVLIVSCLVVLEYLNLLQSAENADRKGPRVFMIVDHRAPDGYRRHVLQSLHAARFRHKGQQQQQQQLADPVAPTTIRPPADLLDEAAAAGEKNEGGDGNPKATNGSVIQLPAASQEQEAAANVGQQQQPAPKSADGGDARPPECPMIPPDLRGRFPVELKNVPGSMEQLEAELPDLRKGGRFSPAGCRARHKVAVIVPYRDREHHLRIFLLNIHRFLGRQQIDYGVYIVEQFGNGPFNRAMLMNVGAAEALKQHDYQCFIFHDVDLLPEDDRNLYTCPIQPRHMSVSIDSFMYRLPYDDIFGGVSAMTVDQFRMVNGFSNMFWGWGGEDDDMANRLRLKKLFISRYPANIARYKMLKHGKEKANPERFKFLYSGAKRIPKDGYNSLKYKKVDFQLKHLYTWILVDLPHLKV